MHLLIRTIVLLPSISFINLAHVWSVQSFHAVIKTVWSRVVMARYSHKGHDTVRYDITQNIAIRYDTIQKCFTVCKNHMLSVTNYSHIVAATPIFTAPTRSFEVGHGPTADESSSHARHSAGVS